MTVDDMITTLKEIDGDIKNAFVVATDGVKTVTIVCGKIKNISGELAAVAEKDEDVRRVIGYTAGVLTIGK